VEDLKYDFLASTTVVDFDTKVTRVQLVALEVGGDALGRGQELRSSHPAKSRMPTTSAEKNAHTRMSFIALDLLGSRVHIGLRAVPADVLQCEVSGDLVGFVLAEQMVSLGARRANVANRTKAH